jgi:hypothetical protein
MKGDGMRKYRGVLLVAAGIAAIATAAAFYAVIRHERAANAPPVPELLSEVPPGAPSLIYIDLAALRASNFYQHRPDRAPIAMPDRDYADFVQGTGFDFEKDLDRVVIASWPFTENPPRRGEPQSSVRDQKRTIVVADGRFDRQKIHDYAVRNGKLDRQQGHDVFLYPAHESKSWNSLVFLDDHRIALVEGSSIAPVLASHSASFAADPVRGRAARVADAAVFAISRVPAIPDNFAPGGMQFPQLAGLIRSVQWITLTVRPEGENLRVSIEGECRTDTDARQLRLSLEMLRMFGRVGLESPKSRQTMDPTTFAVFETLLKTAKITETAGKVHIVAEITSDVLKLSGTQKAR